MEREEGHEYVFKPLYLINHFIIEMYLMIKILVLYFMRHNHLIKFLLMIGMFLIWRRWLMCSMYGTLSFNLPLNRWRWQIWVIWFLERLFSIIRYYFFLDLSYVNSMNYMFSCATSFIRSTTELMEYIHCYWSRRGRMYVYVTSSFNQPLDSWDRSTLLWITGMLGKLLVW